MVDWYPDQIRSSLFGAVIASKMSGKIRFRSGCKQVMVLTELPAVQTDAVKRNCIKVLPHMLVIHLKRFEYDYETMTRGKIKDRSGTCLYSCQLHLTPCGWSDASVTSVFLSC